MGRGGTASIVGGARMFAPAVANAGVPIGERNVLATCAVLDAAGIPAGQGGVNATCAASRPSAHVGETRTEMVTLLHAAEPAVCMPQTTPEKV